MSYQAMLTHVVADDGAGARLRMAASVASVLGCEVIGLGARAPWPYADGADGDGAAFEAILRATRENLRAAETAFQSVFGGPAIASSWRADVGYPDVMVPRRALAADLVLAYPTRGEIDRSVYTTADIAVMESGLPVLLTPSTETVFKAGRVLVAWKNTRESRGAISAAMPLLKKANRVLVAAVCGERDIRDVEAELSQVAERLGRHGANVSTLAEVDAPGAAGRNLLRIAETDDSDLIVAGAYGHSRLREWMLGGVTRDLIEDGGRYVLLSH